MRHLLPPLTHILLLLFFFLPSPSISRERPESIRVLGSSPPDGTIVKEGYDVRLSCKTSLKWFFCLWRSPDGNKQCAIQESTPRSVCSPDERVVLEGGPRSCELLLRNTTSPDDYGSWLCTVSDAETFESAKHYISLEIAVPAVVEFHPEFGEERVLTITENEEQSINCRASNAHPTPIISWEAHESLVLDTGAEPSVARDESSHSSRVNHASVYKAKLEDNNRIITCVATQLDHDGRTVLYENSASIKLNVEKIILPVDFALHQRIGIISGVLLFIIFLLLLILCLFIFLCRRKRNRQRRREHGQITASSSHHSLHQTPSLKPIWTVKQRRGEDDTAMLAKKYEIKISPSSLRRHESAITISTIGSHEGSWIEIEEENRSIGSAANVSLHCQSQSQVVETHFDETMEEESPPRPVIINNPPPHFAPSFFPPSTWRPNSAAQTSEPFYHFGSQAALSSTRPASSLSYPNSVADPTKPIELFYYNFPSPRRLPTPNGLTSTSGVSVFDCDLGCFKVLAEEELAEASGQQDGPPDDVDFNDIITRNQGTEPSEEEPRDL